MIRALIFDFDGLILETETPVYQSWKELYSAFHCDLSFDYWSQAIGVAEDAFDPFESLEKQLGHPVDRSTIAVQRRQRESQLIADQPVMPGVRRYLQDARRLSLLIGLGSSSTCDWVKGHLSRLGLLQYFDSIKARDDVVNAKPDPAVYRAVLGELDLRPDQAVVFEDSPNGILAARQAGIFCVAVPNKMTEHLPLKKANMRLQSLTEIPLERLLDKIERKFL